MNTIRHERTGDWKVTFCSYAGTALTLAENASKEEAKQIVQQRLRRARRHGKPISKIGKGEWEIQTPDSAGLISDSEGFLTVRPQTRAYRVILGRRCYL